MERAERVVAAMVTVERKNPEMELSPEPAVQRVVAVVVRPVALADPVERTKSWRGAPHKGLPPMCDAVSSSKRFASPV